MILSVGYHHDKIIQHFKYEYKSLNIQYSIEEKPLGTGGAILHSLKEISNENFFVMNGDTLFNIDLKKLLYIHMLKKSKLTIALKEVSKTDRFGKVTLGESNLITSVSEKKNVGFANEMQV